MPNLFQMSRAECLIKEHCQSLIGVLRLLLNEVQILINLYNSLCDKPAHAEIRINLFTLKHSTWKCGKTVERWPVHKECFKTDLLAHPSLPLSHQVKFA